MLKIVVLYMFSWEKWALIMMVMMAECKDWLPCEHCNSFSWPLSYLFFFLFSHYQETYLLP